MPSVGTSEHQDKVCNLQEWDAMLAKNINVVPQTQRARGGLLYNSSSSGGACACMQEY